MVELIAIITDQSLSLSRGEVLGVVIAYALGCLTTGYYLVRWRTGQDIRALGSGNVGARNVHRALGRWGFIATFLGDFAKGFIAIILARRAEFGPLALLLVLLAVVAGHNWPVQLGFRGGKGISTSLGAIFGYHLALTAGLVIVFVTLYAFWRRFTVSGLAAYACAPVIALVCQSGLLNILGMTLLAIMVLAAHHQNLRDAWGELKPAAKT